MGTGKHVVDPQNYSVSTHEKHFAMALSSVPVCSIFVIVSFCVSSWLLCFCFVLFCLWFAVVWRFVLVPWVWVFVRLCLVSGFHNRNSKIFLV